MKPSSTRPYRAATGLVLAVVLLLSAACGNTKPSAEPQQGSPRAELNQALRDRLPQVVRTRGLLRIGTDASYAPMSSFAADGRTIIGVEPDLGAELGAVLGVRVEFVTTTFTDLIRQVAAGELDLGMSAMTDTPERAENIDFVNYFSAGTSIVVQRGNPTGITGLRDLCGKVVAVEEGTTQVSLVERTGKNCVGDGIKMNTYPTNSDALVELRTGRAAAVLNDLPPAVFLVNDPRTKSQYQLASTTTYEPGLYGILVAKDAPDLRDAVQGASELLLSTGVYAEVLERWGAESGAVERISVNSDR